MSEIDRILDSLDPKEGGRPAVGMSPHIVALTLGGLLLGAVGVGFATVYPSVETVQEPAKTQYSNDTEFLWNALLQEAESCEFTETRNQLTDVERRTIAMFAAARFNCATLVKDLISRGVNLDEKRFVRGEILDLEDYAAQFGAIDVVRVIQDERKRREREQAKIEDLKRKEREQKEELAIQREHELKLIMAEDAALRSSIFYERARLDCEVLKERLGFRAQTFKMNECIRQEIHAKRAERKDLGHKVPR